MSADALGSFEDYLRIESGSAPLTVDTYVRQVRHYLRFLTDQGIDLTEVRSVDVADALAAREEEGLAATTLRQTLSSIKHFHRFLVREGVMSWDPTFFVQGPRVPKTLPKPLSVEEVTAIIDQANGPEPRGLRDRAILELLYGAGLRVAELTGLDVDDVDTEDRSLRCLGKGARERLLPIGRAAAEAVDAYLRDGRPVLSARHPRSLALWVAPKSARLSRITIFKLVKSYAEGVVDPERVRPHVFRHSFATHLMDNGADIRTVQELLGHADIRSTQIYTHVSGVRLRSVYDAVHPRA